jgi:hypothetical protein
MAAHGSETSGRAALALALAACFWSALLVAAAFLLPVYSGQLAGPRGVATESATLVAVNGPGVAAVMAIPLLLSLLVFAGLHQKCSRGGTAGTGLAWTGIALLAALAVIGMMSIGVAVLPAVVLLIVAARLTPSG